MTLLDLIQHLRAEREARPTPLEHQCPANQTPCGRDCFIRHACTTTPGKVMALVERLDKQTVAALAHIAGQHR